MALDWGWMADPTGIAEWVAALVMVIVALGVFAVRPGHRAHQAFALFFVLRAWLMVDATGGQLATGATAAFWVSLIPFAFSTLGIALIWFMSVYPERRGWFGTSRFGGWILLAAALTLVAYCLLDRNAINVEGQTYTEALLNLTPLGHVMQMLGFWAIGAATILFALDYTRSDAGRRCRSLYFVLLAFSVHAAYDVGAFWLGINLSVGDPAWGLAVYVPETAMLLVSCGILLHGFERRNDEARARDLAGFFALLLVSLGASVLTVAIGNPAFSLANAGFSRLLTAGLVAYALLSRQLLEIDLVIKWTIKRGAVVGILLAAFFVASQLAQVLLPDVLGGPVIGGIVVGLLLFAIAPLQRFAERLSEKAVPNAKPVAALGGDERSAIYLDMARSAWKDGSINRSERGMLNQLQARLGISDAAAKKLEDQATHP